ncbi:MAG TPA: hypothetical protein DET40_18960 [Lentisphaeria bacterium]|nr:MAG: hypothetical protein A2X45_25405 [Lentisphaerae bacterium GWF2_50_93]HCE45627.1 hypothetical protein [Lentisphaeria bacterium]
MNVLLASSKYMPEYSGSGFRAHNLYRRLSAGKPDINVSVITGSETENSCGDYTHEGFKVRRIACKPFPSPGTGGLSAFKIAFNFHSEYSATMGYLRTQPLPDLVHVFGKNYVTATVLNYARLKGIPAIIELCNEMDTPMQYVPVLNRIEASAELPGKYHFVCISERLKTTCIRCGIPEENLWSRPNPVDESLFRLVSDSEKISIRKKLTKFGENDKVISYIAKFMPRKNHKFLVEVLKYLPAEYKLFLAGPVVDSGPLADRDRAYFSEIRTLVSSLGIDDRVQMENGFIGNIQEYYQMSDIYGFPTLSEGLGTPLLESVACGLPVVANRIEGITDVWIKDGENGYVSDLVPELFAEKIRKASAISMDDKRVQSGKILRIAGTSVIDAKYYELIKGLCR